MARTKVVMKPTTTTTSDDTPDVSARAKNQTASVQITDVKGTTETPQSDPGNEKTKEYEPGDGNSSGDRQKDSDANDENGAPRQTRGHANRGDGATKDGATTVSMAELTAALTQMATLMTRMGDRMGDRINDLGTAVRATASMQHHYQQATTADTAATTTTTRTAPPATSGSTRRTTTAETTRQDTPAAGRSATQRPQRGSGDEDDGDGDDSSSSSSESDDDNVRQVGGLGPPDVPVHAPDFSDDVDCESGVGTDGIAPTEDQDTGEAVEKATEISDPIYNVAQGTENIGQAFVTAPDPYVVSVSGTTGHMAMIPGVGSAVVAEEEKLALFTNPRGVYNKFIGLYETPHGRAWNGTKAKVTMVVAADDILAAEDDDGDAGVSYDQPFRKQKTVANRQKAATRLAKGVEDPREKPDQKPPSRDWSDVKCYACYQPGYIEANCPDTEARARNEAYLPRRNQERKQENEERATTNAATFSATVNDVKNMSVDGMKMSSSDESVAAIRAVTAHLKQELASRDSERAKRYVSAVRPAMAAMRYEYRDGEDGGTRPSDEGAEMNVASEVPMTAECVTATQMAIQEQSTVVVTPEEDADTVATPEEGGGEVRLTEEGALSAGTADTDVSKVVDELAAMELGMKLTDMIMMKIGGVATVRLAVKKSKRGEKQQRAREKMLGGNGKLSKCVKSWWYDGNYVLLMNGTETNKSTDVNVEASDGLPTAAMLVEGVTQCVKIDSEGISGFLLNVLGVWTFNMVNVYGQKVSIDVCIVDELAAPDGEVGDFVPTVNNGAVMLAPAVTKVKNGRAPTPAINTYGGRVKLPNKRELGLGDVNTSLEDGSVVDIGTQDGGSRAFILKLLRAYRDLANAQTECPPATTHNVEHRIDTGDAAPIMMRRRRQAQIEDAIVDSNVGSMLSAGVIEHGDDVYPLPRIDETLESLGGAQLFSTLDLRSGYWQIRVEEENRDKTAFTTKRGLYRFKRIPFGLCKALATFQRLMNGVLRGLTWLTCLIYLDDIIIFTRGGVARYVVELACVFERLREAGLSLKLKKCTFLTNAMEYLGHHLSDQGVHPAERLVKSVREFPQPADAHEVKRFVHPADYYRKFIAVFGSIVEPLTRLLKKDMEWQWTEAQKFAFERVKMLLTTRPLLLYPNFKLPFRLVNSKAEANYSITELECLAVVWTIKTFRPYLYGRAFTLITDHSALKWLMTRTNLAGRLHRWSLVLQEYEFQVEYRPGATNLVADALSGAPAVVRTIVGRQYQHVPKTIDATVETATVTTTGGMVNTPNLGDGQDTAARRETPTADDAASVVMASVATVRGVNARGNATAAAPALQVSSVERILPRETTVETTGVATTNDGMVALNGTAVATGPSDGVSDAHADEVPNNNENVPHEVGANEASAVTTTAEDTMVSTSPATTLRTGSTVAVADDMMDTRDVTARADTSLNDPDEVKADVMVKATKTATIATHDQVTANKATDGSAMGVTAADRMRGADEDAATMVVTPDVTPDENADDLVT
ncbi:hypothetical protein PHMEG_00018991 [Phytophthora megakarya]|uniref:Reverse transcriptase domain-containing protein n=1 Tax=Phytophthora megakarya TaxID=4795 RepID=A0A225VT11_9STRA|nr:hypothetical protein PHMEG_00018991 [Phytophthora megakarya]